MPETDLVIPRLFVEFADPDDEAQVFKCDLTWLTSQYTCIFGRGCAGIYADRPDDGCCTLGAHFAEKADEKRVRRNVRLLDREHWQLHDVGRASKDAWIDTDDEGERKTAVHDGACVFLNRPGFPGGEGCALHGLALRTGRHPLETKPDVCWQLPIFRSSEWEERLDETQVLVTTITEFNRRGWGEGGHDLSWWCSQSPEAHVGRTLLYESYADELTAMIGAPAYALLKAHCDVRRKTLAARHPASTLPMPRPRAARR